MCDFSKVEFFSGNSFQILERYILEKGNCFEKIGLKVENSL
jgi:hypothetical protein